MEELADPAALGRLVVDGRIGPCCEPPVALVDPRLTNKTFGRLDFSFRGGRRLREKLDEDPLL